MTKLRVTRSPREHLSPGFPDQRLSGSTEDKAGGAWPSSTACYTLSPREDATGPQV